MKYFIIIIFFIFTLNIGNKKVSNLKLSPTISQYNDFYNRYDRLRNLKIKLKKLKNGVNVIPYLSIINDASYKHKLEIEIIIAVILKESNGYINAKSNMGAQGLMQLMPKTAKYLGCDNVLDPKDNIFAGSKYYKMQLNRFNSKELALAAYNAGPGNVSKYNGIPPFKETLLYVNKVMNVYNTLIRY